MSSSSTEPRARYSQQTLLIDADDTLWENNIYFERAIASFISFLNHKTHTVEQVREHLNLCERATIAAHGYGVESFRRSLVDCFEQLTESTITAERHAQIVSFTEAIASNEIELLPGVEETLEELSQRHQIDHGDEGKRDGADRQAGTIGAAAMVQRHRSTCGEEHTARIAS